MSPRAALPSRPERRLLALLSVVGACSGAPAAAPPSASPGLPVEATARAAEPVEDEPPTATAEARPVRVLYDLARHLERAELREGRALVIDLGAPGGAKHDLGGWQTFTSTAEVDGVSVTVGRDNRMRLVFAWDPSSGPLAMALRARPIGSGALHVYVNDHEIGAPTLPAGEMSTTRLTIPAERLTPGENTLLLRIDRAGALRGIGRAAVAVDWLRLAPSAEPPRDAPPPSPEALATTEGDVPALQLPAGGTLGWPFEVPAGSRLRGLVTRGAVRITVARDGADPRALVERGEGPIDVDLAALAGEVVRLDLTADGGPATVLRPAVVVPDGTAPGEAAPRPRNVLVYLIDTLRADKLSPYNPDTRVRTPGLSRFLAGATVMEGAHSQENWTKPSVATLLTSLMPWEHTAVRGESVLPQSVQMLPEILGAEGFRTGCFIANGYVSDRFGFRQGWDTYRNYIREGLRTRSEFVAADVLAWLDQQPEDQPFFLYVHTIDPHVPYRPPDEFVAMYGDTSYRGPVSFRRDATLLENIKLGRVRLEERDRRHLEALYDGEISYHDVHFDAILAGLERRGLADDTLVVVTSDHGEEFWDHGSVGHGHSVFEELLRVPMFVRMPGVTDGLRRLGGSVGLVDVMPTVLDALGLDAPAEASGRSFLPRLRGHHQSAPPVAVSGFMDGWRTIVIGRHKLIHRGASRLYVHDLEADGAEQTDLAEQRPLTTRWLRGELGLALAGSTSEVDGARRAARPRHAPQDTEIDPETAAQLRALGYVH